MPINSRREPSIKDVGWLVLAMVAVLAIWISTAGRQDRRYEDRVNIVRGAGGTDVDATEQSLDALVTHSTSETGAAGEPIKLEDQTGAYARRPQTSSLPVPMADKKEPEKVDSTLAGELDALAKSKKSGGASSSSGWQAAIKTGKAAASGYVAPFTPPKASFGSLGASDAGGGGGSGAGYSVSNDGFFNTSKANPSRITTVAPDLSGATLTKGKTNAMMDALKKTEGLTTQSMGTANNDEAAGYNSQAFDLASSKNPSLNLGGAGAPLVNEGGAVKDLKDMLDAKKKLDKKDPNIDKVKDKAKKDAEKAAEKKNNPFSSENMTTMIMTMAISTVIGGVMGPLAGGLGAVMTSAMGMPQSQYAMYNQPNYTAVR